MKKMIAMALFATMFVFNSCKKDDDDDNDTDYTCTTCVDTPEALAVNDASSAGIYKSVMLGSTGTVKISLYNGNTDVTAVVTFDGKTATFTTTDLTGWSPGQAISNAMFTGTIDGETVTVYFSVDANGANPVVTCTIPGHTVNVQTYKEYSNALVKSYEGSYVGDDSGGLNIVMRGDDFIVVITAGTLAESTLINGKVDFVSNNTTVNGEFINPDLLRGTWSNTSNEDGTWEAQRTL